MSSKNKEIVEKVNAGFAENDPEVFLSNCAEDVVWTMIGEKTNNGKQAVRDWMKSMGDMEPPKFTVDNLIADGNLVVATGDMTMKGKDGKPGSYAYCDIYRFAGDKIAELNSFVIKTEPEKKTAGA